MMNEVLSKRYLKINNLVIGMHDNKNGLYSRVAGIIKGVNIENKIVVYNIIGKIYRRPYPEDNVDTSGILYENEVEIIDQSDCKKIIDLYELTTEQIINRSIEYNDTVKELHKIFDIAHRKFIESDK